MTTTPSPAVTIFVDQSSPLIGICAKDDHGNPVSLEDAFRNGFRIRPEDAPVVLTLIQNFVAARDHSQI